MCSIAEAKNAAMLQSWKASYDAYKASGMTMRGWCNANQIPVSTFTYRLRRLRGEALNQLQVRSEMSPIAAVPGVAPVTSAPVINLAKVELRPENQVTGSAMHIHCKGLDIDISPELPETHLRILLEVMLHAQ